MSALAVASAGDEERPLPVQICAAAVALVGVSGAALSLMAGGRYQETVCASDELAARVEELQFALGEGPALDAHREGRLVLEPDLGQAAGRWPGFAGTAVEAGVRAAFAVPLRLGAIRMGALGLYRIESGPLGREGLADVLVLASLAFQVVLDIQAQAPSGHLHPELALASPGRLEVHQATGIVACQLGIGMGDALARLQARAFGDGRPLAELAADVVARRLRFDDDTLAPPGL